jgi:hypothetical protein
MMTANLLDHLQEQGYDPQDEDVTSNSHEWFDLVASGIGMVRVEIDDTDVIVYAFDGGMICEWQARLSSGAPAAVILAVIVAAEDELATKRGGPVTPAQMQA